MVVLSLQLLTPVEPSSPQVVRLKCVGYNCRGLKNATTARNSSAHTHSTTPHPKPSKFDENIEDTIPVDIGENGTLIPDYDAKDKVGTIVLTKEEGVEDPPPVLQTNAVLRKKFSSRGKKKSLSPEESVTAGLSNVTVVEATTDKVSAIDVEGSYGTRIEKRKINTSPNNTVTVTVSPLALKRRAKRPKRSPIQFYDDGPYNMPYRMPYANKQRRYVRFPLSEFPPSGVGSFRPSRPIWGSNNNQFPDSLVPRSPRLVFRDPIEPGTLQAPFFGPNGNLQDISAPEENRGILTSHTCTNHLSTG